MIKKIISGGQTGADRSALDFAIQYNISHGGWVPKGRRTEAGALPDTYRVIEMATRSYARRTEKNVCESDGTLIVSHGRLTGGSALTIKLAKKYKKPWLHIDLNRMPMGEAVKNLRTWLSTHPIEILNVAGPPASKDPEIYQATWDLLQASLLHSEGGRDRDGKEKYRASRGV